MGPLGLCLLAAALAWPAAASASTPFTRTVAGAAPQAVTSRLAPAHRNHASPNLVCRISYIHSMSPMNVPTMFGPITGFGVIFGGLVRCNLPIGIGLGAQLTTPRGTVKSEVGPKDTVGRHLRVAGGYYESTRQSWRVLLIYGLAAAPNYRWIRKGGAGGCHGYGTNLLLCATHGRVFR